ncbi:hypothetical protein B0H13DRAFT_2318339 [Mycena leptocephala]|nr:hypothetical protein B0H13DRAFT_2318339 [Mycena leptocephala]
MSAHLRLNMSAFPRLERLVLIGPMRRPRPGTIVFRDAPLLRDVEISDLLYDQVDLPLEQLTTCDVQTPPVELHSLRSLEIFSWHVLLYLTVPRLERLQITYWLFDTEDETDALQSLLSRSSCDLQFLSVTMYRLTPAQSQRFFRAVNSIVHLQLTIVDSEFRHLEICGGNNIAGADHFRPLLDMLWWRQTHTGLESFELSLYKPSTFTLPAAVMTDFRALAEAGLQLRVVTRDERR